MKSKLELCEMIYEMYMAAFMAGSRCDDVHIGQARAKREDLLTAVKFLWNETDDLARDYEQLEEDMCRECDKLRDQVRSQQETIRKLTHTVDLEEVPDHHDAFDSMFPGCTPDDLPFPEVKPEDC